MTLIEQVATLRRTFRRMLAARLSSRSELSFTQLLALNAIAHEEIGSQAELAERLVIDAPSTSRLVDRLVHDGLLTRCPGQDRRCVRLEVTPAGARELKVLRTELDVAERDVRSHLTEKEAKQLGELLAKLQDGLGAK